MRQRPYPEMNIDEENQFTFPEKELWMAVIDRALRDYCFFFEKLFHHSAKKKWGASVEDNLSSVKAIRELNRLRWFLFAEEPQEFNMQYILENIYDNYDEIGASIRYYAKQQFRRHVEEIEKLGTFKSLVMYIRNETKAMDVPAATTDNPIRRRRLRVIN